MCDQRFENVVHHGGHFATDEYFKYIGGETTNWSCDLDRWSYFEVLGKIKEMGYISIKGCRHSILSGL